MNDIILAIDMNNIDLLLDTLYKDPKLIDTSNKYGITPVIFAVHNNDYKLLVQLLSFNPNLESATNYQLDNFFMKFQNEFNMINTNEKRALWYASHKGSIKIIRKLIDSGAKYNYSKYSSSPLAIACKFGKLNIVKYLLKKKDINLNYIYFDRYDYDFSFALKEAVRYKYDNIISELLKHKVKLHFKKCKLSIFEICAIRKYTKIFDMLMEKFTEEDNINNVLSNTLRIAARFNAFQIVEILLTKYKKYIDVNFKNIDGDTALKEAYDYNNSKITKLLIEYGGKL